MLITQTTARMDRYCSEDEGELFAGVQMSKDKQAFTPKGSFSKSA